MNASRQSSRNAALETACVFILSAALCLWAGVLAWRSGRADLDALAALSHAFDVVHREARFNLGLVGFGAPPLPTLLYLPACSVKSLATSGLACPLLGAVMLGFTACLLNGGLASLSLGRAVRWPLVALLILHPLTLSLGALGSPGIILAATALGATCALMRWSQDESFRDLVTASLLLTAAALTHYSAIWLVVTAALYVAWRTRGDRQGWARTEGTLIAFLLPIVYCYAVWIGANWAIMGDPLHFTRAATPPEAATPGAWWWPLAAVVGSFPLVAGLVWHELRGVARRNPPGRPGAWLVVGTLLAALGSSASGGTFGADTPWGALVPLAVISVVLGLALLGVVAAQYAGRGVRRRRAVWGSAALCATGILGALWLESYGQGIPVSGPYVGRPALSATVAMHLEAGALVRDSIRPDRKAYILGGEGFAVSLYAGTPERTALLSGQDDLSKVPFQAGDLVLRAASAPTAALGKAAAQRCLTLVPLSGLAEDTWRAYSLERRG